MTSDYDPTRVMLRITEEDRNRIGSDAENLALHLETAFAALAHARREDTAEDPTRIDWALMTGDLYRLGRQIKALTHYTARMHKATDGGPTGLARSCGMASASSAQRLHEQAAKSAAAPTIYDRWLTDRYALDVDPADDGETTPREADRDTMLAGVDAMIPRLVDLPADQRAAIMRHTDPVDIARDVITLYGMALDTGGDLPRDPAVQAARRTALRLLDDADRSHAARWHHGA